MNNQYPPGGPPPYRGTQYAGPPPAFGTGAAPGINPYYYNKKKMKGWQKALIIIGIVIAALVFFIFAVAALFMPTIDNSFVSPGQAYLAKVSVVGEIGDYEDPYSSSDASYHHDWTIRQIDALIDDPDNKGLILYVDSPGGGVYESDELYLKIKDYQKYTNRPVYVYMGSMAASGGYYISAPADLIYANRNTWTGSIGVIVGTLFDVSGFLEKYGITATDITSGPNKAMGGNFAPLTDEQRAILQSMVDEAYEQFVGIVADGRDMTALKVKTIADGRIYTAKQAENIGLIDGITTEAEAYQLFREEAGDASLYIQDVYYQPEVNLFGSLGGGIFDLLGLTPIGSVRPLSDSGIGTEAGGDVSRVLELMLEHNDLTLKYMYGN
ncbi:MAG: signal peptide peptidase SppA [Clostridiales Family XIII bacterium]|jgi:protease-4|nr:signal peptide peptidase SppA [Clostridiales Family XIII bacterium]